MKTFMDEFSNQETKTEVNAICVWGPVKSDKLATKIATPIVSIYIRGRGQSNLIKTQALLDSGSNRTFCSTKLADELYLKGQRTSLSLEIFGEDNKSDVMEYQLEVKPTSGK